VIIGSKAVDTASAIGYSHSFLTSSYMYKLQTMADTRIFSEVKPSHSKNLNKAHNGANFYSSQSKNAAPDVNSSMDSCSRPVNNEFPITLNINDIKQDQTILETNIVAQVPNGINCQAVNQDRRKVLSTASRAWSPKGMLDARGAEPNRTVIPFLKCAGANARSIISPENSYFLSSFLEVDKPDILFFNET